MRRGGPRQACQERDGPRSRVDPSLVPVGGLGKEVLDHLAPNNHGRLATIASGLLAKDIFVRVEDQRTGSLGDTAPSVGSDEACKVEGEAVFTAIEEDLKARMASPVQRVE
jgi:hypothetical protein